MAFTPMCPLTQSGIKQKFGGPPDKPFIKIVSHDGLDVCDYYRNHTLTVGLTLEGRGHLQCDEKKLQVSAGDIFLIESLKMWNLQADDEQTMVCHLLHIEPDWSIIQVNPDYAGKMRLEVNKRIIRSSKRFPALIRAVEAICCGHTYDGKEFGQAIGKLLAENCRFHPLPEEFQTVYEKIQKARKIMLEQMEYPPKASEIAETIGMIREFFIRSFQRIVGVSPGLYQHCLRQLEAQRLLMTGMSISEVAMATGYTDQSHFHKTFNKFFNLTPRQACLTSGLCTRPPGHSGASCGSDFRRSTKIGQSRRVNLRES